MSRDIKQLKPQKNGRYQQGYVSKDNLKKLLESQRHIPIIYRSSLEKQFIMWCEKSDKVKWWASECIKIPYISAKDNKPHTYNPDFICCCEQNGVEIKYVIEIKPFAQCFEPKYSYKDDYTWNQYIVNACKWKAAREWCQKNGWKFLIITEKFFG